MGWGVWGGVWMCVRFTIKTPQWRHMKKKIGFFSVDMDRKNQDLYKGIDRTLFIENL